MDWDVVEACVLEPGRFRVKFADGLEGTVRFGEYNVGRNRPLNE